MSTTLSASNPQYKLLEDYVRAQLIDYAPLQEQEFVQEANSQEFKETSLKFASQQTPDLVKELLSIFLTTPLSTVYDDPVSSKVANDLLHEVRAKALVVLPNKSHDTYGGFCCAPTSSVNAHAVPIPTPEGLRVFIVFESGLFTFVHGLISTLVDVVPEDIATTPEDWEARWSNHCTHNKAPIVEAAQALQAWVRFFSRYNARRELSYVPLAAFNQARRAMILTMVAGCEWFITAHEYVHAISGHHDASLDARAVEADADAGSAHITVTILREQGLDVSLAVCGIALFLLATEQAPTQGPHGSSADRLVAIMNATSTTQELRQRVEWKVAMWSRIFQDLCAMQSLGRS